MIACIMYAFSRTVFIIVKFLKLVLNYCEMHQSGRKRFFNDSTSYLKDFNFQVHFTILPAPTFPLSLSLFIFFFLFLRERDARNKEEEKMPITFMKPDKRGNKKNVLCNSNKSLDACSLMKITF